jgi:endo-1,4-beta-xylanase
MKKLRIVVVGVMAASALYWVGPSAATASYDRHGASPAVQDTDQPLRVLARRHNLRIGTAVDMNAFNNDAVYADRVNQEFSAVTAENVMKWSELEPTRGTYNWGPADQLVANARANGQIVHGHTLIWHNQLPAWLTEGVADGSIDSAEFRSLVRRHIFNVVGHFRGKIAHWDVANEIFTDGDNPVLRDTVFLQNMGPDYIADALRWAHRADPKAKLWLNDYAIDNINPKSTAYLELAKSLLRQRVPLHGMGFQGHLDLQYPIPIDAADNLRRFDALGLQTGFTEVDVRYFLPSSTYNTAGQVGSFNVLLNACLLVKRCEMFTLWGFTDKYSWVPGFFDGQGEATPLDENFGAKPAYRGLQQVLSLPAVPGPRRY